MWHYLPRNYSEWRNYNKYLVVVLQLLGNSCSCYNINCITKLWAPALNLSIYTWFSWHCFSLFSRTIFNVIFELNPQLNLVESFRTHISSDSSVSCQNTYMLPWIWFIQLHIFTMVWNIDQYVVATLLTFFCSVSITNNFIVNQGDRK